MAKVKFKVDEETKKKRRWTFKVLTTLLIISVIMLSLGYPFNRETALAFTIGLVIALILKIIDWVEESKLAKKKK